MYILLFIEVTVRRWRTGTFGLKGEGSGDFLGRNNYAIPEWVVVKIRMYTKTFAIFPANETAIIGKIAQLKVSYLIPSTVSMSSKTY